MFNRGMLDFFWCSMFLKDLNLTLNLDLNPTLSSMTFGGSLFINYLNLTLGSMTCSWSSYDDDNDADAGDDNDNDNGDDGEKTVGLLVDFLSDLSLDLFYFFDSLSSYMFQRKTSVAETGWMTFGWLRVHWLRRPHPSVSSRGHWECFLRGWSISHVIQSRGQSRLNE